MQGFSPPRLRQTNTTATPAEGLTLRPARSAPAAASTVSSGILTNGRPVRQGASTRNPSGRPRAVRAPQKLLAGEQVDDRLQDFSGVRPARVSSGPFLGRRHEPTPRLLAARVEARAR